MSSIIEISEEQTLAELRLQVHNLSIRNNHLVLDNMARQNERVELVQQIDSLKRMLNETYGTTNQQGEPE